MGAAQVAPILRIGGRAFFSHGSNLINADRALDIECRANHSLPYLRPSDLIRVKNLFCAAENKR
jgi:hypothetical protein